MPDQPHKIRTTPAARYALALLTTIYTLNFLDRQVITILIDPIKRDYHLSDKAIGFISGFGFVIMYSLIAPFVARWADRGNRRNILTAGLVIWSGMTALAGIARNALQLTLARFGVGIGEAAGTAPSASIISDLFPGDQRAMAMSVYQLGPVFGGFLGAFIGGWINQYYGWHQAFLVAGIPGLIVALIFHFTVREPARGTTEETRVNTQQQPLGETLQFLFRQKSWLLLLVGFSFTTYIQFGFGNWTAPFLGRVRHLNSAQIGTYLGTVRGLAGLAGTLLGGYLTDWFGHRDPRWRLYVPAICSILACPGTLLFLFSPHPAVALAGFALISAASPVHVGPVISVSHSIVKVGMRTFSTSLLYLITELIGMGGGTLIIGALTDHYLPRLGPNAIRYSMSTAAAATLIGGVFFILAAQYLKEDSARTLAD
jgi:predicted MFS family arabinose efflux permease